MRCIGKPSRCLIARLPEAQFHRSTSLGEVRDFSTAQRQTTEITWTHRLGDIIGIFVDLKKIGGMLLVHRIIGREQFENMKCVGDLISIG